MPYTFDQIRLKFEQDRLNPSGKVIPEDTLTDLNFNRLFERVDNTRSACGRQYLYSCLRILPYDTSGVDRFDRLLDSLTEDQASACKRELATLDSPGAYYVQTLTYLPLPSRPPWFGVIPFLACSAALSIVLVALYPALWWIFFTLVLVNFVIHYWNKRHVISYSNSVPQLMDLVSVARRLCRLGIFEESLHEAVRETGRMSFPARFIAWDLQKQSGLAQIGEFIMELVKIVFLAEPLLMFRIFRQLDKSRPAVKKILDDVGELDTALSIDEFRQSLPAHTIPAISDGPWSLKGVYHPLLGKPVDNDISIDTGRSVLVTGSNMSGKTTFIRTLGVNVLLAQTINTACARAFHFPGCEIFSSIENKDQLEEGISFFQQELNRVHSIMSKQPVYGLVLIDELFKGTNSLERKAAARAVLAYLTRGNTVIATTHDLELAAMLAAEYDVYHFSDEETEEGIQYDYRLKAGVLQRTNAIRLMELSDFPQEVIDEAYRGLDGRE